MLLLFMMEFMLLLLLLLVGAGEAAGVLLPATMRLILLSRDVPPLPGWAGILFVRPASLQISRPRLSSNTRVRVRRGLRQFPRSIIFARYFASKGFPLMTMRRSGGMVFPLIGSISSDDGMVVGTVFKRAIFLHLAQRFLAVGVFNNHAHPLARWRLGNFAITVFEPFARP